MTGLVRKATLLTLCGVLLATVAMANVPSPANSTVPPVFPIVGQAYWGGLDPAGAFTVTVCDIAGNVIVGSYVCIDVMPCIDIHICLDQLDPDVTVYRDLGTTCQLTNGAGQVTFIVVGGARNYGASAGCDGTPGQRVRVVADGVVIGEPITPVYDQDGQNGVGANDFAVWIADYGSGRYWVRSDYDGNGSLGANDLAMWIDMFGSGGSALSCPEYPGQSCPPGR